ncbi:MAG TPA: hypothetical protein VK939_07425 [Longimicrobiales bacterium]|nr:hypothetical protein [Longimicrobiales bacterium]
MIRNPVLALVAIAAIACSADDPVSIDGLIVPSVVVDGVTYFPDGSQNISDIAIGPVHATVQRRVDCSRGRWLDSFTHVSAYCPLDDGESNFLDAGTPIHLTDGVPAGERLAFYYEYGSEWVALIPQPGTSQSGASYSGRGRFTSP